MNMWELFKNGHLQGDIVLLLDKQHKVLFIKGTLVWNDDLEPVPLTDIIQGDWRIYTQEPKSKCEACKYYKGDKNEG